MPFTPFSAADASEGSVFHHLRLVVDRIPSMLAYWDRDTRCRFANRAYEKWFGVDPSGLIGRPIRDLLGPELYALNERHIQGALRGEEQLFERIVPGPDGVQRHSLANYIPHLVDGVVLGFMVQVTEVTQLKQMEAALKREQALREQVERHAMELDALLKERGEILDVLAHEVRQPLNNASAAIQSAEAALAEIDDSSISVRLARAQAVMGRVLESIDNTLAVASLLARTEPIVRDDTDIDTLVAVAIADMEASQRKRVRVERGTPTRTASMDMSLMRLALRNLLSNALKYSPLGSPVTVRLSDSDEPLALLIDVEDCGSGVEASLVPQLFERGTRGARVFGRPGHGLGLYIVRRVMELHGGSVQLLRNTPAGASMRLVVDQSQRD
jgi:two-component system OmpR family sensor kinase